jgi:Astacin (Peptidase family M12A)
MLLTPKQYNNMFANNVTKRGGLKDEIYRWPNSVLTYEFDPNLQGHARWIAQRAINHIQKRSCVRFKDIGSSNDHPGRRKKAKRNEKKKNQGQKENYVYYTNGPGCTSYVGMVKKGRQEITLNPYCQLSGAIHETLHALGFIHMQQVPDRDNYVNIHYDNIQPAFKYAFEKTRLPINMFNTKYDYDSVMHYVSNAYAIDMNRPTMTALNNEKITKNMGRFSGEFLHLKKSKIN